MTEKAQNFEKRSSRTGKRFFFFVCGPFVAAKKIPILPSLKSKHSKFKIRLLRAITARVKNTKNSRFFIYLYSRYIYIFYRTMKKTASFRLQEFYSVQLEMGFTDRFPKPCQSRHAFLSTAYTTLTHRREKLVKCFPVFPPPNQPVTKYVKTIARK